MINALLCTDVCMYLYFAAIGHSVTAQGITHKNILLGLSTYQLHALDMRQVSPRRPTVVPTQAEKEEGLMQYHPFVAFAPMNMITYNYTLSGAVTAIYSYPTMLESTSIVFSTTTNGIFCNRIQPSQGFDAMPSDFNAPLLLLILAAMVVAIATLRKVYKNKQLSSQWA